MSNMSNISDNGEIFTRFEPTAQFTLTPSFGLPFRAVQDDGLEQLKERLLRKALDETGNPALWVLLRRAANDAASLAWSTPEPLLVFPLLFEEKAMAARKQYERQQRIRQRSERLLEKAA
jgi:hypothetical protein